MRAFTVVLLGAPDTGQSQLLEALTDHLKCYTHPVYVATAEQATSTHEDLTLLMGLGALQSPALAASDQSIRLALARKGTAYEVLYGSTQERLAQALHAVEKKLAADPAALVQAQRQTEPRQKPWVWLCDKCSDPQCEHALLTQLLAQRATAP